VPDQDAVARFIERFAGGLTDAGMPRMPARVFVALLATDSGRLTAAELAERLHSSAGAISGAVPTSPRRSWSTQEFFAVLQKKEVPSLVEGRQEYRSRRG